MKKLMESQSFWYALIILLQTIVGILTAADVGVLPAPTLEPSYCPPIHK